MCRLGLLMWRTAYKLHPISSGKDTKLETIAHLLGALLGRRSVQARICSRVPWRNPRSHTHPSSVRYPYNYLLWISVEYLQLVTKPFTSASTLSKPFRAPTFVRPEGGLARSVPIAAAADKSQPTTVAIDMELPAHSEEDMEETEHRECTRSMGNPFYSTFNFTCITFSLADRITGRRYVLAAWIFYESTG